MLQSARAGGERVFDILDSTEERKTAAANRPLPEPVRGEVEYRGVQFNYTDDKPALNDITLIAKPGQMTALVGPTGSRQIHPRQPPACVLRDQRRQNHHRRPKHRRDLTPVAAAKHFGRQSGAIFVQRHRP